MASYTFELREICADYNGVTVDELNFKNLDEIIAVACGGIFDFNYPIFDEDYRSVLERKIVSHFYMREIGFETISHWKLMLRNKMNEIMPYYNQLYLSEKLITDPLINTDYERTIDNEYKDKGVTNGASLTRRSGTTNSNNTRTANGLDYDLYSDTPQGALNGVDSEEYLTNARKKRNNDNESERANASITDDVNNTNNVNENKDGTSNSVIKMKGIFGTHTKAKMLSEYRDTFLNIDMSIIRDLESLFMQIW